KIADAKDVAGAYRRFEFDITSELAKTGRNVLAVEVFAQTQNDLGINWVDWNPTPPDKNMGLWQDVELKSLQPWPGAGASPPLPACRKRCATPPRSSTPLMRDHRRASSRPRSQD